MPVVSFLEFHCQPPITERIKANIMESPEGPRSKPLSALLSLFV